MSYIVKKKLKHNPTALSRELRFARISALRRHRQEVSRRQFSFRIKAEAVNQKVARLDKSIKGLVAYLNKKDSAQMLSKSSKSYKYIVERISSLVKKFVLYSFLVVQFSLLAAPFSFASTPGDDATKIALAVTAAGLTLIAGSVAGILCLTGGQNLPQLIDLSSKVYSEAIKATVTNIVKQVTGSIDDTAVKGKRLHDETLIVSIDKVDQLQKDILAGVDLRVNAISNAINPVEKIKETLKQAAGSVKAAAKNLKSAVEKKESEQQTGGTGDQSLSRYRDSDYDSVIKNLDAVTAEGSATGTLQKAANLTPSDMAILEGFVGVSPVTSSSGADTSSTSAASASASAPASASASASADKEDLAPSISEPLLLSGPFPFEEVGLLADILFTFGFAGLYFVLIWKMFQLEIFLLRYMVWESYFRAPLYGVTHLFSKYNK